MEDNKIDINSLIGFFLIGFIFIGWLWLNPPPSSPVQENIYPETINSDEDKSISSNVELSDVLTESIEISKENEELNLVSSTGSYDDNKIKFETDQFLIEFSSLGGQISSLQLKNHFNYLGDPVVL